MKGHEIQVGVDLLTDVSLAAGTFIWKHRLCNREVKEAIAILMSVRQHFPNLVTIK